MQDLIEYIRCNVTIIINWLPIYHIVFGIYLSTPVLIISYYHFKNPQIQPIVFAIILFVVWLIQIVLWNQGYNMYYET